MCELLTRHRVNETKAKHYTWSSVRIRILFYINEMLSGDTTKIVGNSWHWGKGGHRPESPLTVSPIFCLLPLVSHITSPVSNLWSLVSHCPSPLSPLEVDCQDKWRLSARRRDGDWPPVGVEGSCAVFSGSVQCECVSALTNFDQLNTYDAFEKDDTWRETTTLYKKVRKNTAVTSDV